MAGDPVPRKTFLGTASAAAVAALLPPRVLAARAAGKSTSYDYVTSGIVKGSQVTTRLPDGTIDVRFAFIDRGRGPSVRSTIALDAAGFIKSLRTTGYDYLKSPVDETFAERGGVATWKNASENAREHSASPRFYVSMNGSPEEGAILVRALQKKPNAGLWPAGTASLNVVKSIEVSNGGATERVTMYEVTGLDFQPAVVWLDARNNLFMSGSTWGAVIPSGWRSVLPQLIAEQDARDAGLGKKIAQSMHTVAATALAVTRTAVFDAEKGALLQNHSVLVKGDKIVSVGPGIDIPSDARRIDGLAKTVLPGLWNMHMHLYAPFGPRLLAEGITTIRDPGNDPDYISKTQKAFASGELLGPRVVIAGLMDGKGKYTAPIGTTADTEQAALAQVADWQAHGAVQIKMYSSLDPKFVPVIAAEAHRRGMRVSGHVPSGMIAQEAIAAGFDEIQHVNMLFLNFMPDIKNQTQTPVRLTAPALRAGTIDLNGNAVQEFIALMKSRNIVSDPTLGIFYFDAVQRAGGSYPQELAQIQEWLPVQVRRSVFANTFPKPNAADKAAYEASADAFLRMVKLLHDNGIRIVAGTDDVLPGFDTIAELQLYAKAGIPNAAVLQAATIA
ncbi:MAG TPA: hypothetical protein VFL13_13265, partial [Candidatus Baltobacteraceae bacterium]|nr:hypothetical protein [Candidatus Baltobacteraceae bacterium]